MWPLHLALPFKDFQRTVIRRRKQLNLSYTSVLLNKIINKQKTSNKKIWIVPLSSKKVTGLFKHLKYLMASIEHVKFGEQSNYFKDKESEIKKPASNLKAR